MYHGAAEDEVLVKTLEVDPPELTALREAQLARLDGTYWEQRDDAGEPVRALVIPIDQAMEAVAREYGVRGSRP